MGTTTILIVDDHALTRAGFACVLRDAEPGYRVVEAGDADEALKVLRDARVDVVVLDLGLPGRSGIELLRQLHLRDGSPPVLILSAYPERQYAMNVLRAGARGYLSKTAAATELVHAVRAVRVGRRYVSAAAADLLVDTSVIGDDRPAHARLSARELDIFLKLARGQTTSALAVELRISPKTVSTYRTRVLEKLGLRTNADLTRYALDNELID